MKVDLTSVVMGGLVGMLLIAVFARGCAPDTGMDDTDNWEEGKRSGMRLYFDYGTGCQYLGTRDGGLTPRLDSNGEHICKG